jgi:hypothetical protein
MPRCNCLLYTFCIFNENAITHNLWGKWHLRTSEGLSLCVRK